MRAVFAPSVTVSVPPFAVPTKVVCVLALNATSAKSIVSDPDIPLISPRKSCASWITSVPDDPAKTTVPIPGPSIVALPPSAMLTAAGAEAVVEFSIRRNMMRGPRVQPTRRRKPSGDARTSSTQTLQTRHQIPAGRNWRRRRRLRRASSRQRARERYRH